MLERGNTVSYRTAVEKEHLAQDVRLFLQTKDYILMKSVAVHKSDIFLHKSACVRYDNFPECQNL